MPPEPGRRHGRQAAISSAVVGHTNSSPNWRLIPGHLLHAALTMRTRRPRRCLLDAALPPGRRRPRRSPPSSPREHIVPGRPSPRRRPPARQARTALIAAVLTARTRHPQPSARRRPPSQPASTAWNAGALAVRTSRHRSPPTSPR
ncbi:hypothetical protein ACP4OV_007082 [Aristida adscensionis]